MEDHNYIAESLLALTTPTNDNTDDVLHHIRMLRNYCARGPDIQKNIASNANLLEFIQCSLFKSVDSSTHNDKMQLFLWQLLANCIVNNKETQQMILTLFGSEIISRCAKPFNKTTDIQLMILYNVLKEGTGVVSEHQVLRCTSRIWRGLVDEKCTENLEYLHFCFEHFIVDNRSTVRSYDLLESIDRIAFLDYIDNYVLRDSPNGHVSTFLLNYFSKEFKKKSDCIMRPLNSDINNVQPREAYSLLRIIAAVSGNAQYSHVYSKDHSLFLNVSSLLRCLVAVGKTSTPNVFTPMDKLEDVAIVSKTSYSFENEISFELKTMLVRCVANMLYDNRINKSYCVDTQLIPVLLECTNMDARNPLIREWSILAIRNGCANCPEIQEIIANLTNQGIVKNDVIKDLNIEMGSLRIK